MMIIYQCMMVIYKCVFVINCCMMVINQCMVAMTSILCHVPVYVVDTLPLYDSHNKLTYAGH